MFQRVPVYPSHRYIEVAGQRKMCFDKSAALALTFTNPSPSTFREGWRENWHVNLSSGGGRAQYSVDLTTPVFAPPKIDPCGRKLNEHGGSCFDCGDSLSFASGACRNSHFVSPLSRTFRHHIQCLLDEALENSTSWGFSCVKKCFGERTLAKLFLLCIFSGLQKCDNVDCQSRFDRASKVAPPCGWTPFREFILTVVSCKAWRALVYFGHTLWNNDDVGDGMAPGGACQDVFGMFDILQWANRNWDSRASLGLPVLLMSGYQAKALATTQECRQSLGICPARLWNLSNQKDGVINIEFMNQIIVRSPPVTDLDDHSDCTAETCSQSTLNYTFQHQAHKCEGGDCREELVFDPDELNRVAAADQTRILAWSTTLDAQGRPQLCSDDDSDLNYMAISHVWSDGTGVGVKPGGRINRCLFTYFAGIATSLGCRGLWWDAISIPSDRDLRRAAIASMLDNYEKASVTLVHDNDLTRFAWRDDKDDGSPAAAVALSSWFTRGWAAAELLVSRNHPVKIAFGGGDGGGKQPVVIKDLDRDVLAQPSRSAMGRSEEHQHIHTLGHLAASDAIRSLRPDPASVQPAAAAARPGGQTRQMVTTLRGLLSILRSRSTSWAVDQSIIAGLLCLTPQEVEAATSRRKGVETAMTTALLRKFGTVPVTALIHDRLPLAHTGPWSWCPRLVFDLGRISIPGRKIDSGVCRVSGDGALFSHSFDAYEVRDSDVVIPLEQHHPALVARVEAALAQRESCLLLTTHELLEWDMPLFLLAQPLCVTPEAMVSCQWIAWVYVRGPDVVVKGSLPRELPRLAGRRALGDLGPGYPLDRMKTASFLDRKQGVVIGQHHSSPTASSTLVSTRRTGERQDSGPRSSSLAPMSFDRAAWALERILLSETTSTVGPAWILSDPFLGSTRSDALAKLHPHYKGGDRRPQLTPLDDDDASSSAPPTSPSLSGNADTRCWPAHPVYVHADPDALLSSTASATISDDDPYSPFAAHASPSSQSTTMAVLGYSPRHDENLITRRFLRTLCTNAGQDIGAAGKGDEGGSSTQQQKLYWTLPCASAGVRCERFRPAVFGAVFRIVDEATISRANTTAAAFGGERGGEGPLTFAVDVLVGGDFIRESMGPRLYRSFVEAGAAPAGDNGLDEEEEELVMADWVSTGDVCGVCDLCGMHGKKHDGEEMRG